MAKRDKLTCSICGGKIKSGKSYVSCNNSLLTIPVCSLKCYKKSLKSLLNDGFYNTVGLMMGIDGEVSPMTVDFKERLSV